MITAFDLVRISGASDHRFGGRSGDIGLDDEGSNRGSRMARDNPGHQAKTNIAELKINTLCRSDPQHW